MIEAKITCQCSSIRLTDLDINLTKGMVVFMEATKARSSTDLQRAWKSRGVSIQYVERIQEVRDPSVTYTTPPPSHPSDPTGSSLLMDPDDLARRVVAEIGSAPIQDKVRVEVGRQVREMEDRLLSRIVSALREEIAKAPSPVPTPTPTSNGKITPAGIVAEDVPLFIPSRIGSDDMKADVAVKAQKGDAKLTDAAAALKAARKSKK